MIFFYDINIFMFESEQRNKIINLKLEIHIQIWKEKKTKILLKKYKGLKCYLKLN
jgi:hypothetical protein